MLFYSNSKLDSFQTSCTDPSRLFYNQLDITSFYKMTTECVEVTSAIRTAIHDQVTQGTSYHLWGKVYFQARNAVPTSKDSNHSYWNK